MYNFTIERCVNEHSSELLLYSLAYKLNKIDIFKTIDPANIDINSDDGILLKLICKNNDLETLIYIIDKFNITNITNILTYSINYKSITIIQYILDNNFVFNKLEIYKTACINGNLDLVKILLQYNTFKVNSFTIEAIRKAYSYKHYDIVKYIINNSNSNVIDYNGYIFRQACLDKKEDIIKLLLEAYSNNPNSVDIHYNNEEAIYNMCCKNISLNCLQILLTPDNKYNINLTLKHYQVFEKICRGVAKHINVEYIKIFEYLLSFNIDYFYYIIYYENIKIFKSLCNYNYNELIKNLLSNKSNKYKYDLKTIQYIFDWSYHKKDIDLIKLLLDKYKNINTNNKDLSFII